MYFHLVTIKYHKLITAAFNLNPLRSTCTYYQYTPHFSLTLFTCKHIFVLLSLFPIASTLCEVLAKVHSVEIMKELCCMFVCLWSLNSLGYVLQNIYSMTELSILIIAVCLSGHLFFFFTLPWDLAKISLPIMLHQICMKHTTGSKWKMLY